MDIILMIIFGYAIFWGLCNFVDSIKKENKRREEQHNRTIWGDKEIDKQIKEKTRR